MLFYKRLSNNDQWASTSSSSTYNLSESQNSSQSAVKLSSQTIFNSTQLNKLINQSKQQQNQCEISNEMLKEDSILSTGK